MSSSAQEQFDFPSSARSQPSSPSSGSLRLVVTLDLAAGGFAFDWFAPEAAEPFAQGMLTCSPVVFYHTLAWTLRTAGAQEEHDACTSRGTSARAFVNRLQKRLPAPEDRIQIRLRPDQDIASAKAGLFYEVKLASVESVWRWLGRQIQTFAQIVERNELPLKERDPGAGRRAAYLLACVWQEVLPGAALSGSQASLLPRPPSHLGLRVTLDLVQGFIQLDWSDPGRRDRLATGRIRCTGSDELTWDLEVNGTVDTGMSTHHRSSIRAALNRWLQRFPPDPRAFSAVRIQPKPGSLKPVQIEEPPFGPHESPWPWLETNIQNMAQAVAVNFSPLGRVLGDIDPLARADQGRDERRWRRQEEKRAEEEARRQEILARQAEARRRREQAASQHRHNQEALKTETPKSPPRTPPPPVPVRIDWPGLEFQETAFPLTDLRGYYLRERASLWWVSNQSDDLLCLPHCRIQHLEYQMRTALRVLGPLRGRALLSDEVGLGKTIEAGLVLKELLTRGLVKRFLVLTVPSLVDQWEEELNDKFGLAAATTNQAGARGDLQKFWRENPGIVASLHTLKQSAQLEIARQVHWDILIVDEAHYLRNRASQAWQAVNALPRQFLLLLTATPVQNSLEELYNLVTLLQPGQLPTPKEFRARFLDPKRPRQPREPEELRRLLGQVMIRNTRANAGMPLPPRRAETVLFEPDEAERSFWQRWEAEFRARLSRLSASQASLWGRLLLQAAGSSPAAWRGALEKFPDRDAVRAWRDQAPLETSWLRKCELLLPLTHGEGGAVIFTQFLHTQAALAEQLRRAGVNTFVINGATPAPERQPITDDFHRQGGALLLTHSGTEGRNLQFSHRLANFDLPWNPMEIEQRIGRLHRLGQQHPVRIYNFVQSGTLQDHLLQILQEKLNLFELVIGETGLVLGDRFSSDEFADEVLRRWRESDGRVAEALASLGDELAAARQAYGQVKQLDETLFAKDYESL